MCVFSNVLKIDTLSFLFSFFFKPHKMATPPPRDTLRPFKESLRKTSIREFANIVATYKRYKCKTQGCMPKYCKGWHSDKDRRRFPIFYNVEVKCEKFPSCHDSCPFYHSDFERMFHPMLFKRDPDRNPNCHHEPCAFFHQERDKEQPVESWRFDLLNELSQ